MQQISELIEKSSQIYNHEVSRLPCLYLCLLWFLIISSLQKCVRNHQLYWFLPRHITLQCEGSLRGFSPYKTLRFGSVPKICFFCETCDKHCFSLLHTLNLVVTMFNSDLVCMEAQKMKPREIGMPHENLH